MSHIWIACIIEMINVGGTLVAAILMRWLLTLSTPEKDLAWLKKQAWYKQLSRLKFYRGQEYVHQLRAWNVYSHRTN